MPRKPRKAPAPPETSNQSEPPPPDKPFLSPGNPLKIEIGSPIGPHPFEFSYSTPGPEDTPATTAPAEPLVLTPEMQAWLYRQGMAFHAAEMERLSHWTAHLTDPRNLKVGDLKRLQIDIERCCANLGLDPAQFAGASPATETGRLLTRLYLIREQALGYAEFLQAIDEVLKDRFSLAAIERAILLLGRRPGLSPRKAEELTLVAAAEELRGIPEGAETDEPPQGVSPVICTQTALLKWYRKSVNTAGFIEKLHSTGEISRVERAGRKYQIWFADPERHQRALDEISEGPKTAKS